MRKSAVYVGEFNRCRGDDIRRCARRLAPRGIDVSVVAHRTTLRMEQPQDMDWPTFTGIVRGELTPRIGSVLLHSQRSGRSYLCRAGGNRPGLFERI